MVETEGLRDKEIAPVSKLEDKQYTLMTKLTERSLANLVRTSRSLTMSKAYSFTGIVQFSVHYNGGGYSKSRSYTPETRWSTYSPTAGAREPWRSNSPRAWIPWPAPTAWTTSRARWSSTETARLFSTESCFPSPMGIDIIPGIWYNGFRIRRTIWK